MTGLDLRAPANLASHRARTYWTVRAVPGWLVAGLVTGLVLVGASWTAAVTIIVASAVAVVALGHLLVMPQWRYRVHRWEITDTAVYTQAGWFTQERRIAPLGRIQTVDTQRGPVEQIFRLANVTITTASAKGPLKIHALDLDVAERLVGRLTEQAQLTGGDGT